MPPAVVLQGPQAKTRGTHRKSRHPPQGEKRSALPRSSRSARGKWAGPCSRPSIVHRHRRSEGQRSFAPGSHRQGMRRRFQMRTSLPVAIGHAFAPQVRRALGAAVVPDAVASHTILIADPVIMDPSVPARLETLLFVFEAFPGTSSERELRARHRRADDPGYERRNGRLRRRSSSPRERLNRARLPLIHHRVLVSNRRPGRAASPRDRASVVRHG